MNLHEFDETTKAVQRLCGLIAIVFMLCLLGFILNACVACPAGQDALCPTFPNAAPRQ